MNGDEAFLAAAYDAAVRDTVKQFEATGSPVITDGEQWKYQNFWTYSVQGLANTDADGFKIPFVAGHTRRMPRLTGGPFRYRRYADGTSRTPFVTPARRSSKPSSRRRR